MKKLTVFPFYALGFFALLFLGISSFTPSTTSTKIGVVDLERVVVLSNAGKALQSRLEKFQETAEAEAETMSENARAIRQRIADGSTSLSGEKLAELQKQYEDQMMAIRRFQDDKQREGQKMRDEGLKGIEREIEPGMKKLVDQTGVDLILNNTPGIVVYAGQSIDLTGQLIELLNN